MTAIISIEPLRFRYDKGRSVGKRCNIGKCIKEQEKRRKQKEAEQD